MARARSPNYPTIGLAAALEKARLIHKGEGKNAVPREALAKLVGYGGLNGGSATMLSALGKYGLIESAGDGEARITDLAMRILHPDNAEEKREAWEQAAFKPVIFSEIREKWPDRPPGDESLRSFLARKGFTEGALEQVIQFYHEIIDMAAPSKPAHDSPPVADSKEAPMPNSPAAAESAVDAALHSSLLSSGKPFTVAFDGATLTGSIAIRSVRDIDRLMKVLQAQKAAFEAMLGDEDT